jgi:hypothetical protein
MIRIVGPFALQAAIIVQHAYMGAFAPHAEDLRGADCKLGYAPARVSIMLAPELYYPHLMISYHIVSSVRHSFLRDISDRTRAAALI